MTTHLKQVTQISNQSHNLFCFQQQWCQPRYVFLFCSSELFEQPVRVPSAHPTRHPRSAKCEVVEIGEFYSKLVPKTCSILAVAANGVVGMF